MSAVNGGCLSAVDGVCLSAADGGCLSSADGGCLSDVVCLQFKSPGSSCESSYNGQFINTTVPQTMRV